MKHDLLDFPEETRAIIDADSEAQQLSFKDLKVVVDECVNLILAHSMQIKILEARINVLSQRTDSLTELLPMLKEWRKKNEPAG